MPAVRPIATPTLSISPEKVCYFVTKAHEYDATDEVVDPDTEASVVDDATFQELTSFINGLTEDEQIDLVTLMWLGRGDGTVADWDELREEAAGLHNKHTAAYLLGKPMLGDHLEEGLDMLGISCE